MTLSVLLLLYERFIKTEHFFSSFSSQVKLSIWTRYRYCCASLLQKTIFGKYLWTRNQTRFTLRACGTTEGLTLTDIWLQAPVWRSRLPSTLHFNRHCRLAWESYIENHPTRDSFVNNLAITHHMIRQWGQPRWHWWQHGRHGDLVNCRITAVGKKTTMMTMDVRMLPSMAVVQDMVERWPALSGRYRSVLCPNATCNLW